MNTSKLPQSRQYCQSQFNGLPVMQHYAPFDIKALEALHTTITNSIYEHPRTLAIRFDLRFPDRPSLDLLDRDSPTSFIRIDPAVISRFIDAFKARIKHNLEKRRKARISLRPCTVRYFWCRELGQDGKHHYHVLILLNGDVFPPYLGNLNDYEADSMVNRIRQAWASALGVWVEDHPNLVYIPENSTYSLNKIGSEGELLRRASYMAKVETKDYRGGSRTFSCSQS
jgi:hypothetical protein